MREKQPDRNLTFSEKLKILKKNKEEVYKKMQDQANELETITYYKNLLDEEIDLEIYDRY